MKKVELKKQAKVNPFELREGTFVAFPEINVASESLRMARRDKNAKAYKIAEKLSKDHSFGISYRAEEYIGGKKSGKLVFIKTPRISSDLPLSEVQRHLGIIFQSFTTEYLHKKIIKKLNKDKQIAAKTFDIGFYKATEEGGSIKRGGERDELIVPYLIQEFIQHDSLDKYYSTIGGHTTKFVGIQDPEQWFKIAEKLINIVRRVHNNQIIHGEIEPKNFLIKVKRSGEPDPILVDFGKSFLLDVSLARTATERAGSSYVAPECRNKRDAYSNTADIYALGGVLFFLSTGEAPPDIEKWASEILGKDRKWSDIHGDEEEKWKDEIHRLFSYNTGLMKNHESIVKIIDKCLRPKPVNRYASAQKLLQALNSVNYAGESKNAQRKAAADRMEQYLPLTKKLDPLFKIIISDKLELMEKDVADMGKGHFEIYGEREDLIDTLVKYISVLESGDTYITVTIPDYWTKDNLGINGRFLTVNKDLVRSGVHIRRLFLVSQEDFEENSPSFRILKAHYAAYTNLGKHGAPQPTFDSDIKEAHGTMFVGICKFATREELREYQQASSHVAIWHRKAPQKMMSIIFSSRPDFDAQGKQIGSQIVQVRFRLEENKTQYEIMKSMFEKNVQSIHTLHDKFEAKSIIS